MLKKTLLGLLLAGSLIFNSCSKHGKETETNNKTPNIEDTLLKTAANYYYKSDYESAKKIYLNFLKIKKQKKDSLGIANAYKNLGIISSTQGNYNKSSEYYIDAMKIYEHLKDSFRTSQIYSQLGENFLSQNLFDKALEYFKKDSLIKSEILKRNSENISLKKSFSSTLNTFGTIFDKKNENKKALKYYLSALEIAKQTKNKIQEAGCNTNIAIIYSKEKELEKSFEFHQKSLQINKEIENKDGLATNLINISDIYLQKGNLNLALKNLKDAEKIAKEIGSPDLLKDINLTFSEIYSAKKDFKSSLEYYVLYSAEKDSLINADISNKINELTIAYESDKKEKENQLLKKEGELKDVKNEKQRWGLFGLAGIAGLLGALGFVAYNGRKKALKAKKIIEEQKTIVEEQKKIVEEKNKEITDSINYASRIQNSVLPRDEEFKSALPDSFILYRPKDIVSGDFYWLNEKENKTFFSASDSTGHGVPGAFMSMLNSRLLSEAVNEKKIEKPDEIFDYVRQNIISSLKSSSKIGEQKDGMDSALCVWNKKENALEFALAHNPLYLIRNNGLTEYKADRMPIGYHENMKSFSLNKINLQKNDLIYVFSDGYEDQIGGKEGKKFKSKNFRELLLSISEKPMPEQKEILNSTIDRWISDGNQNQMDDILIIGVKFS